MILERLSILIEQNGSSQSFTKRHISYVINALLNSSYHCLANRAIKVELCGCVDTFVIQSLGQFVNEGSAALPFSFAQQASHLEVVIEDHGIKSQHGSRHSISSAPQRRCRYFEHSACLSAIPSSFRKSSSASLVWQDRLTNELRCPVWRSS